MHIGQMIDNYLYLYNVGQYIVLPLYVDSVTDNQQVSFAQNTPLSRSAPIYSFQNSGPRTINLNFELHRDMMQQINYGVSNAPIQLSVPDSDDYVDLMIKYLQASVVPSYSDAVKMVNPPIVALRMGEIYIKGVVTGQLSLTYKVPILRNGKYAIVNVGFGISEINPYDAELVMQTGSYRLADSLDRGVATAGFSGNQLLTGTPKMSIGSSSFTSSAYMKSNSI